MTSDAMQLHNTNVTTEYQMTGLPHSSYQPVLAPCDFILFGSMKNNLSPQHFWTDNENKLAVLNWLEYAEGNFYFIGMENHNAQYVKNLNI